MHSRFDTAVDVVGDTGHQLPSSSYPNKTFPPESRRDQVCLQCLLLPTKKELLTVSLTWFTFIFLGIMHFYLVFPFINFEFLEDKYWYLFVTSSIYFINTILMLSVTLIEPGIVLPASLNPDLFSSTASEEKMEISPPAPLVATHEIIGSITWCTTCMIHRKEEARIHHCRVCNFCVAGFDHHCSLLGGNFIHSSLSTSQSVVD